MMSAALIHEKVEFWIVKHEYLGWYFDGGPTRTPIRMLLCADWRDAASRYGAGHAAARGCLIDLVLEAWPAGCIVEILLDCTRVTVMGCDVPETIERPTLVEALVAALEAAP